MVDYKNKARRFRNIPAGQAKQYATFTGCPLFQARIIRQSGAPLAYARQRATLIHTVFEVLHHSEKRYTMVSADGCAEGLQKSDHALHGTRAARLSKFAHFVKGSKFNVQQQTVTVRSFRPEDANAVKSICRAHFRSLVSAAVKYYCIEHFRDLIAFFVVLKIFVKWQDVGLALVLYMVYLFARARIEIELYIFWECPDLDDLMSYYMSDPRSHFWVAEAAPATSSDAENLKDNNTKLNSQVVGCVGCCPARDDLTVAQLLRLVVAPDVRRMRHGSRLLAQFENFAKEKGYRQVRLYTNNLSSSHMKFIRQHGYVALQAVPRSLMRGSLIEWKKQLAPPSYFSDPANAGELLQSDSNEHSSLLTTKSSVADHRFQYSGAVPRHHRSVSHALPLQD